MLWVITKHTVGKNPSQEIVLVCQMETIIIPIAQVYPNVSYLTTLRRFTGWMAIRNVKRDTTKS